MAGGSGSAVSGVSLNHFSCSQVKSYLACPRSWSADKIFQVPRPEQTFTKAGSNLHKQQENYYKGGKVPESKSFEAAIADGVLPAPRPDVYYVERALESMDPKLYVDGVLLKGFCDLIIPPDALGETGPAIWDWKNVAGFDYCVEPATDLQMLIYGHWALSKWPEWDSVDLTLVYFSKKSKRYSLRPATVSKEACAEHWGRVVVPAVQAMKALVLSAPETWKDVAPSYGPACEAYGGCALKSKCWPLSKRLDAHEPAAPEEAA